MKPRRIPGPLVADLIATAELLAASPGQPTFRQACMRRAVSGAYYAVFHALWTRGGQSADDLWPRHANLE